MINKIITIHPEETLKSLRNLIAIYKKNLSISLKRQEITDNHYDIYILHVFQSSMQTLGYFKGWNMLPMTVEGETHWSSSGDHECLYTVCHSKFYQSEPV